MDVNLALKRNFLSKENFVLNSTWYLYNFHDRQFFSILISDDTEFQIEADEL